MVPYLPWTPPLTHPVWPFLSHIRPFFTLFKTPKTQYGFFSLPSANINIGEYLILRWCILYWDGVFDFGMVYLVSTNFGQSHCNCFSKQFKIFFRLQSIQAHLQSLCKLVCLPCKSSMKKYANAVFNAILE